MIFTNMTNTRRGITLSSGVKYLDPREMWEVPESQREEIRSLFKSRTFQRFVDTGVFRLGEIGDDDESKTVKTPDPPEDLKPELKIGTEKPVGTETGKLSSGPVVVGHQAIDPVSEDDSKTAKTKSKK